MAFEKNITLDEILEYPVPRPIEYLFDDKVVRMQHPLSTIEIIAFDSSATFILSKKSDCIKEFLANFPLAEDLQEYLEKGRRGNEQCNKKTKIIIYQFQKFK